MGGDSLVDLADACAIHSCPCAALSQGHGGRRTSRRSGGGGARRSPRSADYVGLSQLGWTL